MKDCNDWWNSLTEKEKIWIHSYFADIKTTTIQNIYFKRRTKQSLLSNHQYRFGMVKDVSSANKV